MAKPTTSYWRRILRLALAFILTLPLMVPTTISQATAASGDRTLYLYYTHTKETAKITFRRGGRYDNKGLAQLNQFLRDWRQNEPAKMDPALFDLVWEVYQKSGAKGPIHVVSAYRSPKTNNMLRSKSRGVAKNSRHTQGMALDFFIPGVAISKLRQLAMSKQVGGVGYYPTSGSPFVHLDTGNVRAWPRMTRAQLKKVFPDGKTLHLPNDGVPLSKSGYAFAKAEWTKCNTVPCNGASRSRSTTRVADATPTPGTTAGNGGTILGWLFGDESNDDESTAASVAVASNNVTRRTSAPLVAPIPMTRSTGPSASTETIQVALAPAPAPRPAALGGGATPQSRLLNGEQATITVATNDAPRPRALLTNADGSRSPLLTAYAPAVADRPTEDAQQAVQRLIEDQLTADAKTATPPVAPALGIADDPIRTASLAGDIDLSALGDLIEGTWSSVSNAGAPPVAKPLPINTVSTSIEMKRGVLHAPDLDHITEIFVDPLPMHGTRYAVIFALDEADFDPATELGRFSETAKFSAEPGWGLESHRFISRGPIRVAAR